MTALELMGAIVDPNPDPSTSQNPGVTGETADRSVSEPSDISSLSDYPDIQNGAMPKSW